MNKSKIYVLTDYYLPGYKAGGVLRTLAALVKQLNEVCCFFICTRDRDCGDHASYFSAKPDQAAMGGSGAYIFYIHARLRAIPSILRFVRAGTRDTVYMTSFFSLYFTVIPLLFIRLGFLRVNRLILAPRGELSPGCLAIKKIKKRIFLNFAMKIGLYQNIIWHASTKCEASQIKNVLGSVAGLIVEAPDILDLEQYVVGQKNLKKSGLLNLIFLSRVSPVKNLIFLLRALCKCDRRISLDIYGPLEDLDYWNRCKALIDNLPINVSVKYLGLVRPNNVINTFSKYDLFVFPTLAESFGNVILESLIAGTPVLLSDKTPWLNSHDGGIDVLSLDETVWAEAIDLWVDLNEIDYAKRSIDAINYVKRFQLQTDAIKKNISLFAER
jgi:glycosyltransferase involved in cell wall biosynthesis